VKARNHRKETITFEVTDLDSAYNCIFGRTFLKAFMAVLHPAYAMMKIPGPQGPITILADQAAAVKCDRKSLDMAGHFLRDPLTAPTVQQKTQRVYEPLETTKANKAVIITQNNPAPVQVSIPRGPKTAEVHPSSPKDIPPLLGKSTENPDLKTTPLDPQDPARKTFIGTTLTDK